MYLSTLLINVIQWHSVLRMADKDQFADLPKKTLLRPEEVALFLGVSLKTIYRWYRSGAIEGTKLKRSLRIYRESVLALVWAKDEAGEP